jgi:hypothetical protein
MHQYDGTIEESSQIMRSNLREQIKNDTEDFIAAGGEVEEIEIGVITDSHDKRTLSQYQRRNLGSCNRL